MHSNTTYHALSYDIFLTIAKPVRACDTIKTSDELRGKCDIRLRSVETDAHDNSRK